MTYGWRGKVVANEDGRMGVVRREEETYSSVELTIDCGDGSKAMVGLDCMSKDYGETGWEWYCDNFDGGARWLTLGDHNDGNIK